MICSMQWISSVHIRVVRGSILCDPTQPNPSADDSTQPNPLQVEKFGPNPTQPNTTNNGAYSLVVTYFYTKNLSCIFVNQACSLLSSRAAR